MLKAVAGGSGSGSGGITPGTTVITGGTNTRVLFDDNGVVGESAGLTYTKGNAGTTSLLFIGGAAVNLNSPSSGVLAVGTTAANALGSLNLTNLTATGTVQAATVTATGNSTGNNIIAASSGTIGFNGRTDLQAPSAAAFRVLDGATDTNSFTLSAPTATATPTMQLGALDVDTNAAIVGQNMRTQGALAGGTSNQAGKNFTLLVSPGKGTGVGGSFILQTTPVGSTGTAVNAGAAQLTIDGLGNFVLGNAAIATTATDGFLHAVSGAGTPTGVPNLFTGRVPIYVDTTNAQLWMYLGGAWKQPKTPAGAATVTWQ